MTTKAEVAKKAPPAMTIHEAVAHVQGNLVAPKARKNEFGGYQYRSAEDILGAVKPLLAEVGATLFLTDSITQIGDRIYIEATCAFNLGGESISVAAYAREAETKKGMDVSQVTGAASSYARKYALNGMFLIDDAADADETNDHGISATYVTKLHALKDKYPPNAIRVAMKDYDLAKLSELPEKEFSNFEQLISGLSKESDL